MRALPCILMTVTGDVSLSVFHPETIAVFRSRFHSFFFGGETKKASENCCDESKMEAAVEASQFPHFNTSALRVGGSEVRGIPISAT